jgi:hypothetical protein
MFEIQKATRQGVIPLCGFYGSSGSGKSMSSLLFARGLVGPSGRIVGIDTEHRRLSLFADIIPGGYSVLNLEAPFSPDRYTEAIAEAEKAADVIVIDSLSHEHVGEGGVLEMQESELDRMAGDNYQKREACKLASWIKPKLSHKKMVARLLRSKCAIIVCLRGEPKTHMIKDGSKTKVVTDEFSSPTFDQRFLYELLIVFETVAHDGVGGFTVPRKVTHPSIAALLPGSDEQIGIAHGAALAAWCASPGGSASQPTTAPSPSSSGAPTVKELKAKLWAILKPVRGDQNNWLAANKWLVEQGLFTEGATINDFTTEELFNVILAAEEKLKTV